MAFVCFKRWDELIEDPTDPERRFCVGCERNGNLCRITDELAHRGRAGECVAAILQEASTPIKGPAPLGAPASPDCAIQLSILDDKGRTFKPHNGRGK